VVVVASVAILVPKDLPGVELGVELGVEHEVAAGQGELGIQVVVPQAPAVVVASVATPVPTVLLGIELEVVIEDGHIVGVGLDVAAG